MHGNGATWTDERVALLGKLWDDGLSAAQIARRMDCGMSRSAVLGKVRRLGLSARRISVAAPSRIAERCQRRRRRRLGPLDQFWADALSVAPNRAVPVPAPPRPRIDMPASRMVALVELAPGECRWPFGDGPFAFCGCAALRGASYCAYHLAEALGRSPAPPRRVSGDRTTMHEETTMEQAA